MPTATESLTSEPLPPLVLGRIGVAWSLLRRKRGVLTRGMIFEQKHIPESD
jgi:hypothetical protein